MGIYYTLKTIDDGGIMKEFTDKNGRSSGGTLTVSEFIKELGKFPDDMPVVLTWEGTTNFVCSDDFEAETLRLFGKSCECLFIDAEY